MKSTQYKITLLLVNTIDHELSKREILQRVSYRKDFAAVYETMLRAHVIEERGTGTKYDPKVVRLLDPETGLG
jgi:hypothetical protein